MRVGTGKIDKNRITAEKNGINLSTYHSRLDLGWDVERAMTEPPRKRYEGEYAIYRGDDLLFIGDVEECAKKLGVSKNYIRWLATGYAHRRLDKMQNPSKAQVAVRLDV